MKCHDRVRKYPIEQLSILEVSKLFCKACRVELSLRSFTLMNHLRNVIEAQRSQEVIRNKRGKRARYCKELAIYNDKIHALGEHVPESIHAGSSEQVGELFEENRYCLTDRCNICDLIPFTYLEAGDR